MSEIRRNWTREELIVAFNLYCKIPFSKINYRLPQIQELAKAIGRTPSAVAWKLVNFASLDPDLQKRNISGAKNIGKQDKEIFEEFKNNWEELIVESEFAYEKLVELKDNDVDDSKLEFYYDETKLGLTKEVITRQRVNQSFFRKMILASYENKCCVTGLPIKELLVASHIVPWRDDVINRLNPKNGLCLNSIHDKAFDKGLLTFDEDFRIVLSSKISKLDDEGSKQLLINYDRMQIRMPTKFLPSQDFMEYHRKNIFKG